MLARIAIVSRRPAVPIIKQLAKAKVPMVYVKGESLENSRTLKGGEISAKEATRVQRLTTKLTSSPVLVFPHVEKITQMQFTKNLGFTHLFVMDEAVDQTLLLLARSNGWTERYCIIEDHKLSCWIDRWLYNFQKGKL